MIRHLAVVSVVGALVLCQHGVAAAGDEPVGVALADQQHARKHRAGEVHHQPGRWAKLDLGHGSALKLRLILQPMLRFSQAFQDGGSPDGTVDLIIRRGRLGFQADLRHDVAVRFEISVKNMHFEIHNMFAAWSIRKHLALEVGFIKAPGGLERDTSSFDQPFIERSVMTFFNYDHEVGAKLAGSSHDDHWFWAGAIVRNPPPLEGGDPEDTPQIPSGVEAEDIFRAGSKWNASARAGYQSGHDVEASIGAGTRLRMDEPDFGEIAVEPYDTTFLSNRPYRGVMTRVSGDVAISQPHWKLTAEGGLRRDGEQLAYPDGTVASEQALGGHLTAAAASVVVGYTPHGHYGRAIDAAPLRRGWEIVARVQGDRVKPVDQAAATLVMGELGVHWELSRQIRLQIDAAVEKFNAASNTLLNENKDATRIYGQAWATFRL